MLSTAYLMPRGWGRLWGGGGLVDMVVDEWKKRDNDVDRVSFFRCTSTRIPSLCEWSGGFGIWHTKRIYINVEDILKSGSAEVRVGMCVPKDYGTYIIIINGKWNFKWISCLSKIHIPCAGWMAGRESGRDEEERELLRIRQQTRDGHQYQATRTMTRDVASHHILPHSPPYLNCICFWL